MITALNKLDCKCPNCHKNHDVSMQHDGKFVKCLGCDQPFKIAFTIPSAERKLVPAPQTALPPLVYRPASAPMHTPHPHVQANTQPVIIASFLALVMAVVAIGFAMVGSSRAVEPQPSADLVETKTQELAIDGSQSSKAEVQRIDRVLARLRTAHLRTEAKLRRATALRDALQPTSEEVPADSVS
jgi:hypothetical protein